MKGMRYSDSALSGDKTEHKKSLNRQFFFSVISLFLVMAVFITGTISWFTITTAKLNVSNYTLECGKGLRVNDSGTSDFQLNNVNRYIIPASSVDGRNLFFPADGSDFSSKTEEITYRSSTVGDKNENYIQIDFSLTAQENNTALYLNDEVTSITINGSKPLAAPLRMALWSSTAADGFPNTPIVFNPTGKTYVTAAVESVDRSSGKLQNKGRQTSHAFSDYAYGGDPIAVLKKGIETKFSLILWLEGADSKCTWDKVNSKDIELSIAFTTSWDKTQVVRFKDSTGGDSTGWVKSKIKDGVTAGGKTVKYDLYLRYEDAITHEITDFLMYPHNSTIADATEWMCNMPGDMTNKVSFQLRPQSNTDTLPTYEFTRNSKDSGATDTYDRGVNRLYVAEESAAPTAQANYGLCKGYWVDLGDSDGGGHDFGDIDGDDF